MTAADILILAVYLGAVLVVGTIFFRRQTSLTAFFLGDRNIPWWAAAFSGIATIVSAASFLGGPGQAFKSDLRYLQYRLGAPIAIFIIGWIMIPFFYRLRVFSIYEYLETRFDGPTRVLAGAQFFILKAMFLGIAIYAPSLLFVQITGLPLLPIVLMVGLVTTAYTTLGGVKAVIWTDTLQVFILFGGLFAVAWRILDQTGGWDTVFQAASASGKLRLIDTSWSLENEFTLWNGIFGGAFVLLSQYGVNQAELQKFLTTSSVVRARRALISTIVVVTLIATVFFLVGAGLYVFYTAHPEKGGLSINPDRVLSKFILEELPAGWRGLLMASVAAAAMSAISSILNSLTTVASSDFIGRVRPDWMNVRNARLVTVLIGLIATGAALYVERLGNILVAGTRMQNFFGGSLAGAFLLGMTSRRSNARGAFWGIWLGTAAVALLSYFTTVSWMWHGIFAAAVAYFGGLAISLTSAPPAPAAQDLVWRPRKEFQVHAELNYRH
jgi:SSS family transporter